MNPSFRRLRDFFVSVKLSVALLSLGLLLVFAGTLAQVDLGIWAIQEKFFRSFIALWKIGGLTIPLPGGYTIGGLLLINLLAAHIYRFKFTWKKTGIQLTHTGLILLLVGELLSGLWQEDFSMRLVQGEPKNFSESYRDNELALIDTTDAQFDDVVVIPESRLTAGATLQHPKLPFRVVTKIYYPNSSLSSRGPIDGNNPAATATTPSISPATQGAGTRITAVPQALTYKQDERNVPTAFIELIGAEGSLGTWLVSAHSAMTPQTFAHAGRQWTVGIRNSRAYKPFALTLLKFSHDRYAGTEIPKNFSSRIRLTTPDGRNDREVLIYMNNPLRYDGLTFYQASFDPNDNQVTILQVVRNPSWLIPYIACAVMTLGLTVQFSIHLLAFVGKRRVPRPSLA